MQVPSMFIGCSDAVAKEESDSSIGGVMLILDDDCVETMHGFDHCAFVADNGEQGEWL